MIIVTEQKCKFAVLLNIRCRTFSLVNAFLIYCAVHATILSPIWVNCKESIKRISKWSAHYYTGKNWYQPPDNANNLKTMALFEKETIKKLVY